MKVLVVIRKSPAWRFLAELHTNKLVKEVSTLLAKRKNSQAIAAILAKGRFDREVYEDETHGVRADIILTEKSVHWDFMKK